MSGAELPAVEWYCGTCAGRRWVWCPECVAGCKACNKSQKVKCWQCEGGRKPVAPPDWH